MWVVGRSPRGGPVSVLGALVAALILLITLASCGGSSPAPSVPSPVPPAPSPATTGPAAPGTTSPGTTSPGPTSTPGTTSPPAAPPLGAPGNQPLWPFSTLTQAQAWEQSYRSGGHQPWHLDAAQSALAFTQGYLGFAGIDQATTTTVSGRDAHIGVGYVTTPGHAATAAVIHLVRYGPDADAPWEVVGTADTTLTLTTPAYGAVAASPLTVGGRITGVDESIRVQIRQPSTPAPLGTAPGVPAGGQNTPWTTTVAFSGASDPVLTVVASTGGHFTSVERFAVTAVKLH